MGIRSQIEKRAKKVTDDDMGRVVSHQDEIKRGLSKLTLVDELVQTAEIMMQMVRDYYRGEYRKVPWWAISAITVVLLYFLNPFDLIPDFIPIIGQIDDILVLMVGIRMIKRELDLYMEWKYPAEAPEDIEVEIESPKDDNEKSVKGQISDS